VIVYKKTPHLRLTRAQVPEAPYWAATTIAPYSPRRAAPIAIDYIDLRASCAERFEVSVCENVRDDLERSTTRHPLHAPVLIDAAEFAEVIFSRGEEALQFAAEQHVAAMQVISTRGAIPKQVAEDAVIAIAAWPLEFDRIEALFSDAIGESLYIKMDGWTLILGVNDVDTPKTDKQARLLVLAESVIERLPK